MLHGEVKVNGNTILRWHAVRQGAGAYGVNRYQCGVRDIAGEWWSFTVDHKYEDGAAALAAAVLLKSQTLESSGRYNHPTSC